MKSLLTPARTTLAAALLLGLLAPAGAQSLGAARGETWIGRPLEVTLPVRLPPGEDREECIHADVFYGEARLLARQVRATLGGAPGARQVRVTADAAINEPVVTLSVRAGCQNTVTRSYSLLPGMASEAVLAAAASRSAGAGGAPAAPAAPVRTAAAPAAALRPAASRPAEAQRRPRAAAAARAREDGDAGGRPRLRLDMWEPEPTTLLRVSAQLTEPSQDAAQRAAAALLWQALNADPSELLRTGAALQRLEDDLAQLRATAQQTRAEMAALRQALAAPPRGFQLSGPLTQALMLLLLAGAGAGAFLWWRNARQQHAGRWHGVPLAATPDIVLPPQEAARPPDPADLRLHIPPANAPEFLEPAPSAASPVAAPVPPPVPPAAIEPGPIAFDLAPATAAASASAPASAPAALPHGPLLRIETLAATFQEVEFLSSLGLWDDASDALKAYIEDSRAPAPIALFELMRLYAHGGNAAGEAAVRRRYAQLFGAEPPPLAQVTAPFGLQARSELAARITRSWGKPQALDMIEELLFAVPAPDKALSLEAGRDLLCLYQLALELEREEAAARGGPSGEQGLAPWADAEDAGTAQAAALAAADLPGGDSLALDLDLSVAAAAPQEDELPDLRLEEPADPLLEEFQEAIARNEAARKAAEEAAFDSFSAAVAHESRRPLPR